MAPRPSTKRPRLSLRSTGIAMSPEQFDALPPSAFDPRYRYEIIRGTLIVSPHPGNAEIDPNDELGHLLRSHAESHPQGFMLDRTLPEQTVPGTPNRRRCDRAIWTGLGRRPRAEDVPSIVVEFVAARRRDAVRDYEEKRAEYLAAGVREYWIIDRFRRTLTVYRPDPPGPPETVHAESQTYESPLLPRFALPLGRLLAKADDWSDRGPTSAPFRELSPGP